MKLHLPKSLLVAVLAAIFAPLGANGANGWNGNTYKIDTDGTIESVNTSGHANGDGAFIRANKADAEVTINSLLHANGYKLILSGDWGDASKNIKNLTINTLTIGEDGNGSADIQVGTSMTGNPKQQIVHIESVIGDVASLTIGNVGVLTLDSATISGNVNNSGTLTLGAVTLSGKASNSGTIILQPTLPEGAESLNLNDFIANDSQFNAITNSTTGNIVIETSGNKSLSGALALDKGGKVTLKGGTFGSSSSAITHAITSSKSTESKSTELAFEDIEAYIGGGSQYAPWVVGKWATVHITAQDTFSWEQNLNVTIQTGGVLDLQARQSVSEKSKITLAGGTIKGTGGVYSDDGKTYGLDFFGGGTITVTADSRIETNVGGHYHATVPSPTLAFNVSADKVLTMSGNLVGHGGLSFVKLGSGTMKYQGAAFSNALSITEGVFDYNVAKGPSVSHSGAISGAGTFRKSGEGTLILTGAAGTSSNTLGTLEVTEGVLNLGSAYIANGVDIRGGQLNIGADITLGGAINLAGGVLNLGEGKTIILDNLDSFFTYEGGSPYNLDKRVNAYGVYAKVYTIIDGVTSQNVLGSATFTVGTGENAQQITLTDGKYYVVEGDTNNTDTYIVNIGEVNASSISGAKAFHVYAHDGQDSGCLVLDVANAKDLLSTARGNGEINLATNVSFADGSQTNGSTILLFEGTLSVASGKTLQMGDNQDDKVDFSSLQEIRLDGGNIYYGAKGGKWQHLNVTANSYVHIYDMDTSELKINKVSVAEDATLTINGSSITGVGSNQTWNHQLNIDVVTGDGSAVFNGPKSGESNISTLYIDSLNGFTGNLAVKSYEGSNNKYSAVINTGEAGATFNKLEVSGFNTETFTFVVEGDTKVNTISAGCGISIQLKDTATLGSFAKEGNGTITLTGSGAYDMGSNISSTIVSGLTDADNWRGKVIIRDNDKVINLNLSALGNAKSWVQLKNLEGHWSNTDNNKNVATNLILGNEQGDSVDAFTFNNAYSVMEYTIAGQVKGTGNLVVVHHNNNPTVKTRFTGDVSEWSGVYKNDNATSELTFAGNASTVNAVIERVNEGSLHLTVATDAAASFNKDVTVSKLTLNQSATFNKQLNVSGEVSLVSEKTLQMGEIYSISSSADVAMKGVKLTATEIAGAGTGAEISNSLISIKKNASLTFKDIMMTGVQLSAASADTCVQLKFDNVTQNENDRLVLTQGKFELQAMANPVSEAVVKTGNTTIEYQIGGTPQLTLGTANATVVISANPAMDCGQVLGVYDLVFDMGLQYTVGSGVTEFDWSTVVSFGGPLAELLAGTTDPALLGAEAITALNNPYVTYDYTIVEGLATLNSVTIHGITAPEPTTATLSILALAALAARRRRK